MLEKDCFKVRRDFWSRRFLFRKFFQRDNAHSAMFDADILFALVDGLMGDSLK
jgi:hypothetical protein